jgi:hypothetical protein
MMNSVMDVTNIDEMMGPRVSGGGAIIVELRDFDRGDPS